MYSPFQNNIGQLAIADLQLLIENKVTEGYYIEYKRDFPKNEKVAASIASFANTNGGWYFVGIQEKEKSLEPEKICGIDLQQNPDPSAKLRDIVRARIDPPPIFYSQVILLEDNRAVLIVSIPDDQETPFIADGRIYRRVSDSSEPISENNRGAVDRLVDRGERLSERFRQFCKETKRHGIADKNSSWVNVFLSPYPSSIELIDLNPTEEDVFEDLINRSQGNVKVWVSKEGDTYFSGNIPFTLAQPTHDSVFLKQAQQGDVTRDSLSMELFYDGRAKLHIPINLFPAHQMTSFRCPAVHDALKALGETSDRAAYILSYFKIGELWMCLAILIEYYRSLISQKIPSTKLQVGMSIDNKRMIVPLLDAQEWADHVTKFGLPIVNGNFITIPRHFYKPWRLDLDETMWVALCVTLGRELGLPTRLGTRALVQALEDAGAKFGPPNSGNSG